MPGKYSHSVVLADYSSRGIINLPNDQHVAYLKSFPYPASQHSRQSSNAWTDGSSNTQPRAKSALAYTNHHSSRNGRVMSPSTRVLTSAAVQTRGEVKRNIDTQRPSTSYSSHRITDRDKLSDPVRPEDSVHNKAATVPTPEHASTSQKPVPHNPQDVTHQPRYHGEEKLRAEDFLRETSAPPLQTNGQSPSVSRSTNTSIRTKSSGVKLGPAADIQPYTTANRPIDDHTSRSRLPKSSAVTPGRAVQHPNPPQTQTLATRSETAEPNFDGFSDVEDGPSSYFERSTQPKPFVARTATPQSNRQFNRLETPSPREPLARVAISRSKTNRSISSELSDSELLGDVGASPLNSHGKPDSMTSSSTTSSRGTPSAARGGKFGESKNPVTQHLNQDCRLPEIDENGAFDPDFFTQGPEDFVSEANGHASVDNFLDRPLGTISAGRDIDFSKDNQDDGEDSETDQACPPDIGRFRDDEFGSVPALQKMKSDSMINKAASPSVPKKIGFFARLRSKSRPRG